MRSAMPLVLLAAVFGAALWLAACSGSGPSGGTPVRQDIALGDRQKDWALVYFQSWRRERKGQYLRLARRQMANAVRTYFTIQVRIGHSYPDFYNVDRKRLEGCRFLTEMERDAMQYHVMLEDTDRVGCLR